MRRYSVLLPLVALVFMGNVSTQATSYLFVANMDGPSESPANAFPGTGHSTAVYNDVAHTLALDCSFSGLDGTTTQSHIHAATAVAGVSTAGVATTTPSFAGFPLGVKSGTFSNTLDLTLASSWNPSYVTAHGGTTAGAEADFMTAMFAGKAYWNIHTTTVNGGEIRGFLAYVPEPATSVLVALGTAGLGCFSRRRGRSF